MLEEFKKFIMRGNVVDLAVGVIIGLAFGAIVTSLVSDIIMPIIGAITGGLDFSNYYTPLSSKVEPGLAYVDAKKQGAVLGWGQFLTVALNFLIIAGVLFLVIKGINKLKKEAPPTASEPTPEVKLLTDIRDLLKSKRTTVFKA
jgi:large conductance mechanosensitive channel